MFSFKVVKKKSPSFTLLMCNIDSKKRVPFLFTFSISITPKINVIRCLSVILFSLLGRVDEPNQHKFSCEKAIPISHFVSSYFPPQLPYFFSPFLLSSFYVSLPLLIFSPLPAQTTTDKVDKLDWKTGRVVRMCFQGRGSGEREISICFGPFFSFSFHIYFYYDEMIK